MVADVHGWTLSKWKRKASKASLILLILQLALQEVGSVSDLVAGGVGLTRDQVS